MPTIIGTSGIDTLDGTSDNDTIEGGEGGDLIRGFGGDDILNGGDEVDGYSVWGDGIDGGDGNDQINGGAGNDRIMGGAGQDIIYGGAGDDILTGHGGSIQGQTFFTVIAGVSGQVQINSYGLINPLLDAFVVDTRVGPNGLETVRSGEQDFLYGGTGNDIIYVGLNDTADGGDGTDRLMSTFDCMEQGLTLDLRTGALETLARLLNASLSSLELFSVTGTRFADVMTGSANADDLIGGAGDDTLSGGDGADFLSGDDGSDSLDGGAGNDYLSTSTAGHSTIVGGRSGARLDDGRVDIVRGGDGDDSIEAGLGDQIDGGAGRDTLSLTLVGRTSGVTLDLRTDTASALAALAAASGGTLTGIEVMNRLALTDFDDVLFAPTELPGGSNLYGLGGNDRMTGNAAINFMGGDEGDDVLDGQGGNDWLWGGSGRDILLGGAGDDILYSDEDNLAGQAVAWSFDDVIDGGDGNDTIYAGGGSDTISGGAGADQIFADGVFFAASGVIVAGDDVINGGAGSDRIDGGGGVDTSVYAGARRQYSTVTATTVSGGPEGGTDTLISIEQLRFADGLLTFDVNSQAAQVMRLYDAALDRQPDASGFEAVLDLLEGGQTLTQVAATFLNSPEFQSRYGALTNQQFIEQMYLFCLNRQGDAQGIAAWTDRLNSGTTRTEMLVLFSESAEHRVLTQGALNQGLWVANDQALQIARMYDATFDRLPDSAGLATWTANLAGGMSLLSIATAFASSAEFQQRYGTVSNEQFVRQMYQFTLNREPDAAGLASWTAALNAGTSRAQMLLNFSESTEHVALTRSLWIGGVRTSDAVTAPADDTKGIDDPFVLPDLADIGPIMLHKDDMIVCPEDWFDDNGAFDGPLMLPEFAPTAPFEHDVIHPRPDAFLF